MQHIQLNKIYLTEQCVFRGLFYLAEAMQYYWPASKHANGYLQEIAENNVALQLSRSFSENGFLVWAEVPFKESPANKLDFLAYHYSFDVLVALELKNNIETPQNNLKDFHRLVSLAEKGTCNEQHLFNNQSIGVDRKPDILGVVTILNATEFAEWWNNPNQFGDFKPSGRIASDYEYIGRALEVAQHRAVTPLCEYVAPKTELQYRFRRAAYALYDRENIKNLEATLNKQ